MALARRSGRPLCLATLDIDHFKQVNDNYGHEVGDLVLKSVANQLRSRLRDSDVIARFGGEEFVVLLPDTRPKPPSALRARSWRPSNSTSGRWWAGSP
jgi:diguanylate cyclase (GGDEF)-like protein